MTLLVDKPTLPAPAPPLLSRSYLPYIVVGVLIRVRLSAISYGTDDVTLWFSFITYLTDHTIADLYRWSKFVNHPPLAVLYAYAVNQVSLASGLPFPFTFRIVPIIADTVSLLAIARCTRKPWICAAYAFDPTAIILSGFHGNTDCVYTCLTLLGVIALSQRRDARAGLFLGAALNVKLMPIIVILPLLIALPRQRLASVLRTALPWSIPYIVMTVLCPDAFLSNVFGYRSWVNLWGIGLIISWYYDLTIGVRYEYWPLLQAHSRWAAKVVMSAAILIGALWHVAFSRAQPDPNPPPSPNTTPSPDAPSFPDNILSIQALAATAAATFFAVTPCYFTQYSAILTPLLYIAAPRWALAWSLTSGALIVTAYSMNLTGAYRFYAKDTGFFLTSPLPLVAFPAWLVTACFVGLSVTALLRVPRQRTGPSLPQ